MKQWQGSRRRWYGVTSLLAVIFAANFALSGMVAAATLVKVNEYDPSWSTADTRPGGSVSWTDLFGAPPDLGDDALRLTTDATTAAKAQLLTGTMAGMPLAAVEKLSYWTFQADANFAGGDASFQLVINACGTSGFTTLVFEPYQNGMVTSGVWQYWDVDAGQFWSSRTVDICGAGTLTAGSGGAPFYTLGQIQDDYPDATVVAIGVNVGTFNPSYDVAADGVQFNETVYNFEAAVGPPTDKDQCKRTGWRDFDYPREFKNQGDCVSFVQTGK